MAPPSSQMSNNTPMMFEVQDLTVAAPANVSRCEMVGVRRAGDHRAVATAALMDGDGFVEHDGRAQGDPMQVRELGGG